MSHCEDCVAISWLILVLILHMSLVVAIPMSQLSAVPRKGKRLLLHHVIDCGWLELSRLTAEMTVVTLDLYISCILDNSSCSVVISCVEADGCCTKGSEELLGSAELSLEEFPVAFQISKRYVCSDDPRVPGGVCL